MSSTKTTWAKYWGKTNRDDPTNDYHLLAYHNLDVAAVARVLLEKDPKTCARLAKHLGMSPAGLQGLVTFLLALHDVGKFDETFQNLCPELFLILRGRRGRGSYDVRHDTLGYLAWEEGWADLTDEDALYDFFLDKPRDDADKLFDIFAQGIFGHHGAPVRCEDYQGRALQYFKDHDTQRAIEDFLTETAQFMFQECESGTIPASLRLETLCKLSWSLAGLHVLCDWVGSDETFFTYRSDSMPLETYWNEYALPAARRAIQSKRLAPCAASPPASFQSLFPELASFAPRPSQRWALGALIEAKPQLFILEDETGSGKTEAALILAKSLMEKNQGQGVYIGLPTMATANAMFARLGDSYRRLFDEDADPSIVLAHGRAKLSERFQDALSAGANPSTTYNTSGLPHAEDLRAEAACAAFFAQNRNLALFADVGVGTIDQALLGVLTARHQSLRLFALGRRVLVIDEVHAYDSYTHHLVCNLLTHHAAQGGSAILLSATLPSQMKRELCEAFTKGTEDALDLDHGAFEEETYPLVSWLQQGDLSTHSPLLADEVIPSKHTDITFIHDPEDALDSLAARASEGQCACWIRNTVGDARDAYDALCQRSEIDPARVILFHARMTMHDRQRVEEQILERFGAHSSGARRSGWIVIATQVIEQSLDVDFDYMISDLAPIDLLIQRLGRYRRHARDARGDRAGVDARGDRELVLLAPTWSDSPDDDWYAARFPSGAYVYRHHEILWRSMRALMSGHGVHIPADSRALVEEVYDKDGDVPAGLKDRSDKADAEDRVDQAQAVYNTLDIEEGYGTRADKQGRWLPDYRTPTRLGDMTHTLRLGRVIEDGSSIRIEPWAPASVAAPWAMSEVSIRATKVDDEEIEPALAHAITRAKNAMRDRCRGAILVPMRFVDALDRWEGLAKRDNRQVTVTYTAERGAEVLP